MFCHWIIILCFTTCLLHSIIPCKPGFRSLHESCYHFSSSKSTWTEAIVACNNKNSSLISIETAQEWSAIDGYLKQHPRVSYWTSGTDLRTEKQFRWATSLKHFTDTKWCKNEPNNVRNEEHCVLIKYSKAWCWNDLNCKLDQADKFPIYYICEY